MNAGKIFIIEDDTMIATLIRQCLSKFDQFESTHFINAEDCINSLHEMPDIVIIDYNLPGMDGLTFMKKVKELCPSALIIINSGQEDVNVVVECYQNGANEYILKNEKMIANIENAVRNLSMQVTLRKEVVFLQEQIIDRNKYSNIIGSSPAVMRVLRLIQKVENNSMMVLVTGQSGTGKELVAKALHYNSQRSRKPFVIVNMGAIPTELIESELFGHEKGAFTDARERRIGKFEEADGGTIFLDEIGEMDLGLQSKLLRVLQEKEVTRIGSNKTIKLDFRLIAATNRNLAHEVKEGRFREDLFYRIQGFLIHLPPLKERGDDIILLAKSFLNEFCQNNRMAPYTISKEACKFMLEYAWPGNIRELKAVIERASLMAENNIITVEDLTFVTA
ncbi:MAG: sigma-54-dependent Fis family transcriptional regulator [Bacteroidetes bacterium]|nr:sigma-54-dependent Fis family transcriptional regulator [Bacteroidota bacterium]